MEEYQERMVQEKTELDQKINKLTGFIFSDKSVALKKEEEERMQRQLWAMMEYSRCLRDRIAAFQS